MKNLIKTELSNAPKEVKNFFRNLLNLILVKLLYMVMLEF